MMTRSRGKGQNKRGDTGRHHPYPSAQNNSVIGRSVPNPSDPAVLSERTNIVSNPQNLTTRITPNSDSFVKIDRFFVGLTTTQAAKSLGVSVSTAENDWTYARCWLRLEMSGEKNC